VGRVSVERDTFPALAAAGELFAMVDGAYWLDTGTPQTYLQANVDILNGRQGMHVFSDIVNCSWRHASATVDASRRSLIQSSTVTASWALTWSSKRRCSCPGHRAE